MNYKLTHKKTQKRIAKMMYQRDVFHDFKIPLTRLGWDYTGRRIPSRKNTLKSRHGNIYPSYCYYNFLLSLNVYIKDENKNWIPSPTDIVSLYLEELARKGVVVKPNKLIQHLKTLPIKRRDSKFNQYLNLRANCRNGLK